MTVVLRMRDGTRHGATVNISPTVTSQSLGMEPEMPVDDGTMRTFPGGATRDTAEGKPEYAGYLSHRVLKSYGEYMMSKQIQPDGKKRSGDNWQLGGFGLDVLEQSLFRHFMDVWGNLRLEPVEVDLETSLNALLFNTMALLHEHIGQNRFDDMRERDWDDGNQA